MTEPAGSLDVQSSACALVAEGIEIDLNRCSGMPVLKDTRMPVHQLLNVTGSDAITEIALDHGVSEQAVRDGFAYAQAVFYKAAKARTRKLRHRHNREQRNASEKRASEDDARTSGRNRAPSGRPGRHG